MTTPTTQWAIPIMFLAVLGAAPAAASTIHYNSLQAGLSADRQLTHGWWSLADRGLTDGAGESRILLDTLGGTSEDRVSLSSSLLKGEAWGVDPNDSRAFGFEAVEDGVRVSQGRVVPSYGECLDPSAELWGLGSWGDSEAMLRDSAVGPRVLPVPDPCTVLLLATGSVVFLRRQRPR